MFWQLLNYVTCFYGDILRLAELLLLKGSPGPFHFLRVPA